MDQGSSSQKSTSPIDAICLFSVQPYVKSNRSCSRDTHIPAEISIIIFVTELYSLHLFLALPSA